jgi:cellobiose transport system substrate-binding protein
MLSGAAGGVGLASLAGCGVFGSPENRADKTTLWYWDQSIDDSILAKTDKGVPGTHLVPDKIGGSFRSKLLTTLAGHAYAPDITNINSDIATYFPDSDVFVDLYTLGARDLQDQYLSWKWDLGVTPQGRMIGFPIDTGPTAMMYRTDVFKKAGLPTDPDTLAPMVASWDGYLDVGAKLAAKLPNTWLTANIGDVYTMVMAQSPKQYLDKSGKFIGDQAHVKRAWDYAVKARKFSARSPDGTPDWNAGVINGAIATVVNAVWEASTISQAAASTSGKWRVVPGPGGPGNNGGSFMAITKYCRDPQRAFDIIKWIQSPEHQAESYTSIQLFPSSLKALADPALSKPNKFYSGQPIGDIFSKAAKAIKPAYYSPYDNVASPSYGTELLNVESLGKDPNQAWEDAVSQAKRQLKHLGLM